MSDIMESATEDKYKHGTCPLCPGFLMFNIRTNKPFPTCFKCSSKCPKKGCTGFRGKSAKGYRYSHCPRCTFGDNFKKPEKKDGKKSEAKSQSKVEITLGDEVVINDDLPIKHG